jgi:hypothetical protein
MALLKHQKQEYKDNCGPTCVAMVARTTQSHAILKMFCQRRTKFCYSWIPDIIRGLDGLGNGPRERKATNWKQIRGFSIVSVRGGDHWVVYSPEEELIYDPALKAPKPVKEFRGKIDYYLKVWPKL